MKYPIIINENGSIFFIDSEKGINYLEALDVLNGEYTAYDSSGLPLELSVRTKKMAFGRKIDEIVILPANQKQNSLTLRNVLLDFLQSRGIDVVNQEKILLDDLIDIVGRHVDHF